MKPRVGDTDRCLNCNKVVVYSTDEEHNIRWRHRVLIPGGLFDFYDQCRVSATPSDKYA